MSRIDSKHYKCDSCGASLDIAEDTNILVCRYCGAKERIEAPKTIVKTKVEKHYVDTSRKTGSITIIVVAVALVIVGALSYVGYKSFGETMKEINKSLPASVPAADTTSNDNPENSK